MFIYSMGLVCKPGKRLVFNGIKLQFVCGSDLLGRV